MSLSNILKLTRQKALMTQTDFAKEINVSVATINRWENGKVKPNLTAMKRLRLFCQENNLPFDVIENEWLSINNTQFEEQNAED